MIFRWQIYVEYSLIPATKSAVSTLLSTDEVSHLITAPIIPEVVSCSLPDWVPVLHVCHAVLLVEIIWLSLPPVKPLYRGIKMRPPPVTIGMVRMMVLSHCSHPELITPGNLGIHIRGVQLQQHTLDPVVETHAIYLHKISLMEAAENLSIILGDLLLDEEEAVTHPMILLPIPTIRAVVGILP